MVLSLMFGNAMLCMRLEGRLDMEVQQEGAGRSALWDMKLHPTRQFRVTLNGAAPLNQKKDIRN